MTPNTYWSRTRRLMIVTLVLWAFFGFGIHFFVNFFNTFTFFGFPLGFYLAAQGALIGFVVVLFWFSRAQEKTDAASSREDG